MERPTTSGIVAAAALALSVLVAALGLYSFPLTGVPIGTDSAVFSYVGEVVAAGGMPYTDVFDHKGPLVYAANALATFGPSTWLLWAIEVVVLAAGAYLGYAVGRAIGASRIVSVIVSASATFYVIARAEGGNMTEEYCLPLMMFVALVCARVIRGETLSRFAAFGMGASVAAVFFLRFTALVGLLPFCAWALVVIWRRDGGRPALELLAWFAAGLAGVAAPIVAWLAFGGALGAFVDQYLAFNLAYASDGEASGRWASLAYFATDPTLIFAVVASATVAVTSWRSKAGAGKGVVALMNMNLASLGLLLAVAVATGRSYGHYCIMFAPGVVVALNGAAAQLRRRGAPRMALAAGALGATLALVVVPSAYATYERAAWHKTLGDERAHVAQTVADAADGGEVLAIGNECWVYLDSATTAPSPYAYRSDTISKEYGEWLVNLLSSNASAPSVIVAASYVPAEELESAGIAERYREIERTSSYTVYAKSQNEVSH